MGSSEATRESPPRDVEPRSKREDNGNWEGQRKSPVGNPRGGNEGAVVDDCDAVLRS